jgi:uncharacterized protein YndB with AHSA1/START domain
MSQRVLTVALPAEPRKVFRYLTEPGLLPLWINGLRESRPLGDGVMRVGAKSIEIVEERGKTMEMTSQVMALDLCRALTVRITYPGGMGESDMTYELAPVASGTELSLTVTPRYKGTARLFGWAIWIMFRGRLQASLDRLAQVVAEDGARRAT